MSRMLQNMTESRVQVGRLMSTLYADVLFNSLIRTVVLLAEMFLKVDKFIE